MLHCPDIELLLAPFAADELAADEATAVAGHVTNCTACREELAREIELRRALSTLPDKRCPPALAAKLARVPGSATVDVIPAVRARRRLPVPAGLGLLAASLALFVILAGPLASRRSGTEAEAPTAFTPEQIAEARRDLRFSLTLTARVLDRTGRGTVSEVFSDRLPAAVTGSLRSFAQQPQGG